MQTMSTYDTPFKHFLQKAEVLSINQMVTYTTLTTFFKIRITKEPVYLAKRMGLLDISNDKIASRSKQCED